MSYSRLYGLSGFVDIYPKKIRSNPELDGEVAVNITDEGMTWWPLKSSYRDQVPLSGKQAFPLSHRQPANSPSRDWCPWHLDSLPSPAPFSLSASAHRAWGFLLQDRPISAAALDVGYLAFWSLCVWLFIKTILYPISLCGEPFYNQVLLYLISRGVTYILTKTQTTLVLTWTSEIKIDGYM